MDTPPPVDNIFVATKPFKYDDLLKSTASPSPDSTPLLISAPKEFLIAPPAAVEESKSFILVDNSKVITLPSSLSLDIVAYSPPATSLSVKEEDLKEMFKITYTFDRFRPKVYWLRCWLIFNPYY